jgi:hypothetical protein
LAAAAAARKPERAERDSLQPRPLSAAAQRTPRPPDLGAGTSRAWRRRAVVSDVFLRVVRRARPMVARARHPFAARDWEKMPWRAPAEQRRFRRAPDLARVCGARRRRDKRFRPPLPGRPGRRSRSCWRSFAQICPYSYFNVSQRSSVSAGEFQLPDSDWVVLLTITNFPLLDSHPPIR